MSNEYKASMQLIAQRREAPSITQLQRFLDAENSQPRLVGSTGEEILLPESVYNALRQVIHALSSGQAVTIIPHDREMTTQEAADFLNVSRPYLIKLLEQGEIPYIKVGSHRRVRSQDIMAYKKQRDAQRRNHLSEFTAFLQDEGFYDQGSPDLNS
jgi:excisionase family DNA binding protein